MARRQHGLAYGVPPARRARLPSRRRPGRRTAQSLDAHTDAVLCKIEARVSRHIRAGLLQNLSFVSCELPTPSTLRSPCVCSMADRGPWRTPPPFSKGVVAEPQRPLYTVVHRAADSLDRRYFATASLRARGPRSLLAGRAQPPDNASTAAATFTSEPGSTASAIRRSVCAARLPRRSSSLTTTDGRPRVARAASVAAFHFAQIVSLRRCDGRLSGTMASLKSSSGQPDEAPSAWSRPSRTTWT